MDGGWCIHCLLRFHLPTRIPIILIITIIIIIITAFITTILARLRINHPSLTLHSLHSHFTHPSLLTHSLTLTLHPSPFTLSNPKPKTQSPKPNPTNPTIKSILTRTSLALHSAHTTSYKQKLYPSFSNVWA